MKGSRTSPPVFHRGWIIRHDDFCRRAIDKGVATFCTRELPKKPQFYHSILVYVREVFKEIGVKPPVKSQVALVVGPYVNGSRVQLHVGIRNNYRVTGLLNEEEIERVRRAFGFEVEPRWYISGIDMYWKFQDDSSKSSSNEYRFDSVSHLLQQSIT